jgi:sec-independent protein translocase protein TatB
MFNLGPFELVAIFVVALLVFGPDKLPEMGRQVGKAIREFRKFQESMQGQVREVLEPISGPIIPNGNMTGPQPTNIRGTIPTEVPEGQKENVPKSATIQAQEAAEGEDTPPPGTYGHYAPVPGAETPQNGPPSSTQPQQAGPAPAGGESAAPAPEGATQVGETPPPTNPADPESR